MYLTDLNTNLVDALIQTFNHNFPEPDFRDINITMDMPVRKQDYPGIWVGFNPAGKMKIAGVDHYEVDSENNLGRQFTRWRFQGNATFTCVAMTSLERDRLHDELLRVFAFGNEFTGTQTFRSIIENNDFIMMNMSFDEIGVQGRTDTLGTPWGTDDRLYEVTLSMEVLGEFVADNQTFTLAPIESIVTYPYDDMSPDPKADDDGDGAWV